MDLFHDEIYFENWTAAAAATDSRTTTREDSRTLEHGRGGSLSKRWVAHFPSGANSRLPLAARLAFVREGPGRQARSEARPRCTALRGRQDRPEADLVKDHARAGRGARASEDATPVPRITYKETDSFTGAGTSSETSVTPRPT